MIVVEGPDGSGKTSLVQRLINDLKLQQIPRAASSDAEYMVPLDEWVENVQYRADERIILDRHQLISHLMYGPTMKRTLYGKFQSGFWLASALEKFWQSEPIVIICLPDLATIKANLEVDEHKVAQADIDVFYWNYHAWWASNCFRDHVIPWHYPSMNYPSLLGTVSALLAQKEFTQ